jgi:hypothetical protein
MALATRLPVELAAPAPAIPLPAPPAEPSPDFRAISIPPIHDATSTAHPTAIKIPAEGAARSAIVPATGAQAHLLHASNALQVTFE